MNSYEINILLKTKSDTELIYKSYKSLLGSDFDVLESLLPKLFCVAQTNQTANFDIDFLEINTNEITINCYGTKYPTIEISSLFQNVNINLEHAIKIKSSYDGDGGNEFYCIINGSKCSLQKYRAHYKKNKIGFKKTPTKNTKPTKKIVAVKSELNIQKEALKKEKEDFLKKTLDYGKNRANETALIRLQIRAKAKRLDLRELFEEYINLKGDNRFTKFSEAFEALTTSSTLIITWSQIRSKTSDRCVNTPENLIYGLRFVVEQDSFLYLGFDLNGLDLHANRIMDRDLINLMRIISSLNGVNKTWMKYRPGKQTTRERYLFCSGSESEATIGVQGLTEDSEWP